MKRDILILLAISAAVLLFNLGAGSLSSWDEAFYAQVSREIAQTNNWIDLTWGGESWSDKPPLYMWGTACFYKIFGVNEFSSRLLSSISGTAIILLAYLFAGRLFSRRAGLVSSIMLLGTYHFMWFSKMGTLDVTFTLFLFLSVYCFLRSEDNRASVIYSFVWFSLAFLTKGVGAILIPGIFAAYIIVTRKWGMLFNRYTAAGILVFALITGSWYLAAFFRYGKQFLEGQFLQHLVNRTTGAMDGHHGTWLTYINVVLYKGKPWGAVGLAALPFFVFHTIRKRRAENWILISWIAVVFCVFTLVKTKLHWYIIPVYPALVMVAGWGADRLLKRYAVILAAVISLVSIVYFGTNKGLFTLDYNTGIKEFAVTVKQAAGGGDVYLYEVGDPGARFYFGGFAGNIGSSDDIEEISGEKGAVIVASPGDLERLGIRGRIIPSGRSDLSAVKVE